jgi:hypothetical protein
MASRRAYIIYSPYWRAPPMATTTVRWDQTNGSTTYGLSRPLPIFLGIRNFSILKQFLLLQSLY